MSPRWLRAAATTIATAPAANSAQPMMSHLRRARSGRVVKPASLGHVCIESVLCLPELAGEGGTEFGQQR